MWREPKLWTFWRHKDCLQTQWTNLSCQAQQENVWFRFHLMGKSMKRQKINSSKRSERMRGLYATPPDHVTLNVTVSPVKHQQQHHPPQPASSPLPRHQSLLLITPNRHTQSVSGPGNNLGLLPVSSCRLAVFRVVMSSPRLSLFPFIFQFPPTKNLRSAMAGEY